MQRAGVESVSLHSTGSTVSPGPSSIASRSPGGPHRYASLELCPLCGSPQGQAPWEDIGMAELRSVPLGSTQEH